MNRKRGAISGFSDIVTPSELSLARRNFLVLQLFHLTVFWSFAHETAGLWLFASGAINTVLYAILIRGELRCSRVQIEPLVVYLASGFLRLGLGTCWAAAAYGFGHYHALKFGPQYIEQYLMHGQTILMLGDWCVILGWSLWTSSRSQLERPAHSPVKGIQLFNRAIGLLAFGWLVKLLVAAGVPLLKLGNFASLFVNFASPAAIYLLFISARSTRRANTKQYYAIFGAILLVELGFSFSSYMKSATLILVLALGLCVTYHALARRSQGLPLLTNSNRIACAFVLGFVVFILFPYSQIRRSNLWANQGAGYSIDIPTAVGKTMAAAIPGTKEFARMHDFPSGGGWSFLARHSDLTAASWVCKYVSEAGSVKGEFLEDSLTNLVPRVLWPDKPLYYPGRKISVMTGFSQSAESATTSTGVGGVAASLVLNFGVLGLFVGCLLNGLAFAAFSSHIIPNALGNPIGTLLFVSVIHESAMHFESVIDGGIGLFAYWFIAFLPMLYFSKRIFEPSKLNVNNFLSNVEAPR